MPYYEITQANSSKIVPELEKKSCVVLHHMNGCIHCEMFKPTWSKVNQHYKGKPEYVLVSVEYSSMNLLPKSMQNVQGFPTLRAYKNSKPVAEFNDVRTYDTVLDFVEKHGKNSSTEKEKPKKRAPVKKKKTI